MRFEGSVSIRAPRQKVRDFLTDPEKVARALPIRSVYPRCRSRDRQLGTLSVDRESLPGATLEKLQPFGLPKERPESASGRRRIESQDLLEQPRLGRPQDRVADRVCLDDEELIGDRVPLLDAFQLESKPARLVRRDRSAQRALHPGKLAVAQTRLRELVHAAFELRGEPFSRQAQIGRGQARDRLPLTPYRLKAEEQERQRGAHDRQQIQQDRPPVRKAAGARLGALATHRAAPDSLARAGVS